MTTTEPELSSVTPQIDNSTADKPTADVSTAMSFLRSFFEPNDYVHLAFSTVVNGETDWKEIYEPKTLDKIEAYLEKYAATHNSYFRVHPSLPNSRTRKGKTFATVRRVGMDFDFKPGAFSSAHNAWAALELLAEDTLIGPPTFVMSTGGGYQPYFDVIDDIIEEGNLNHAALVTMAVGYFDAYVVSITEQHGWIPDNVSDMARVLRIAGTLNHKAEYDPPRAVALVDIPQTWADRRAERGPISLSAVLEHGLATDLVIRRKSGSVGSEPLEDAGKWLTEPKRETGCCSYFKSADKWFRKDLLKAGKIHVSRSGALKRIPHHDKFLGFKVTLYGALRMGCLSPSEFKRLSMVLDTDFIETVGRELTANEIRGADTYARVLVSCKTDEEVIMDDVRAQADKHTCFDLEDSILNTSASKGISIELIGTSAKSLDFVVDGFVYLGDVTVFAGPPGAGKSLDAREIAALATRGELDGDLEGPVSVTFINAEDFRREVMIPFFRDSGADPSRVFVVKSESSMFTVDQISPELKDRILANGSQLVIIEDIDSVLGGNPNDREIVSRAIVPLRNWARETGISIIMIKHTNKELPSELISAPSGSHAWGGLIRTGQVYIMYDKTNRLAFKGTFKPGIGINPYVQFYRTERKDLEPQPGDEIRPGKEFFTVRVVSMPNPKLITMADLWPAYIKKTKGDPSEFDQLLGTKSETLKLSAFEQKRADAKTLIFTVLHKAGEHPIARTDLYDAFRLHMPKFLPAYKGGKVGTHNQSCWKKINNLYKDDAEQVPWDEVDGQRLILRADLLQNKREEDSNANPFGL